MYDAFILTAILAATLVANAPTSRADGSGNYRWGEWSAWSPCSAPCGQGAANRTRYCLHHARYTTKAHVKYCGYPGHVQHKVCRIRECTSHLEDIRNIECRKLNSRTFSGRRFNWSAYLRRHKSCVLACKTRPQSYYMTVSAYVPDGTPCSSSSDDVCINGTCNAIGCDGFVGSKVKVDRCGVCGGNGKTCRVIKGLYTLSNVQRGYIHIANIPSDAWNINVTEMGRSRNYLALRIIGGGYLFNGHWRLSRTKTYHIGDASVNYHRGAGPHCRGQCIFIPKPTNKSFNLQLLSFGRNPGISYSYTLPASSAIPTVNTEMLNEAGLVRSQRRGPIRDGGRFRNARYRARNPNKSAINVRKYARKRHRGARPNKYRRPHQLPDISSVLMVNKKRASRINKKRDNFVYSSVRGASGLLSYKPRNNEVLSTSYTWKVSGLTECSKTCGGGIQRTKILCVDGRTHAIVTDINCNQGIKPSTPTLVCNNSPCPPSWASGEWSECSSSCGPGVQSRRVRCEQVVSATVVIAVHHNKCERRVKPRARRRCEREPCARWTVGKWSNCSVDCGHGQRSRVVTCLDPRGDEVDENKCALLGNKPDVREVCDMGSCAKAWFHTQWTKTCSARCGRGYVTRKAFCSADDGSSVHASKCRTAKPAIRRTCKVDTPCGGQWFTGQWSPCSATCGDAVKRRDVVCVKLIHSGFYTIVNGVNCNNQVKPDVKQSCGGIGECPPTWYMTPWSNCSVKCGTGYKTREVKCLTAALTPTLECNTKTRPLTRRSCNTQSCDKPQLDNDPSCTDSDEQFCVVVVQARMCKYDYYRSQCCRSCIRAV